MGAETKVGDLPPPTDLDVGKDLIGIHELKEAEGEVEVATSWASLGGLPPPLLRIAATETVVG